MGLRLGVCVLTMLAISACGNPSYKGPAPLNKAQKAEAGTAFGAAFVVEEALAAVIENVKKTGKAADIADLLKVCEKKKQETGDELNGTTTVRLEGKFCPVKASKTVTRVGHMDGNTVVIDSVKTVLTYSTSSELVLKFSDILSYQSETTIGENAFFVRKYAFEAETVGVVSGSDFITFQPLENNRFNLVIGRDAKFPKFQMQARGYFTFYQAPGDEEGKLEKMRLVLNGQTVAEAEFAAIFPELGLGQGSLQLPENLTRRNGRF